MTLQGAASNKETEALFREAAETAQRPLARTRLGLGALLIAACE